MAHHHQYMPHPVTELYELRAARALAGAGIRSDEKGSTS